MTLDAEALARNIAFCMEADDIETARRQLDRLIDLLTTTPAVADRNTALTNPQAALFAAVNMINGRVRVGINIESVSNQLLDWLDNADNRSPADG